jgi:hypothetical protein
MKHFDRGSRIDIITMGDVEVVRKRLKKGVRGPQLIFEFFKDWEGVFKKKEGRRRK